MTDPGDHDALAASIAESARLAVEAYRRTSQPSPQPAETAMPTEPGTEPDMPPPGTTWQLVVDAMRVLDLSDSAIRRRVRRGELTARHGPRGELLVAVPVEAGAAPETAAERPVAPGPAESSIVLEAVHLRNLLAVREEQVRTLEAELEARRREAQASAEERSELRRLLAQAQSLIPRLHDPRAYGDEAPVSATIDHGAPLTGTPAEQAPPTPRRGWWRRGR